MRHVIMLVAMVFVLLMGAEAFAAPVSAFARKPKPQPSLQPSQTLIKKVIVDAAPTRRRSWRGVRRRPSCRARLRYRYNKPTLRLVRAR